MKTVRYHCPRCSNQVGVSVSLPEPPRCRNFSGHGGNRKYIAMIEDTPTIEQQLEELL